MNNDRLKFRAYIEDFCFEDEEGNEYKKSFMIYGVAVYGGCSVGTFIYDLIEQLEEQGFTDDEIEQVRNYYSENDEWFNFDADEIEQCTGLKDNNGKLVFEGDVVSINGEKWRVIWSDEDCAFFFSNLKEGYYQPILPDLHMMTDEFKVIGNIHKKEELLK